MWLLSFSTVRGAMSPLRGLAARLFATTVTAWTSDQVRGWATATASMTARDSLINRPIMLSVLSEVRPAEVRPAEVRPDVATPRVPGLHALGRGRSAAPVNPPRPGSDEQMFGAD